MTEYDNTNRGVLFKNDRKDSDKHPDYQGNINCNGTEFWLSAWIKEGKKGKFMSLSIKPKDEKVAQAKGAIGSGSARLSDDLEDSIPFAAEFR